MRSALDTSTCGETGNTVLSYEVDHNYQGFMAIYGDRASKLVCLHMTMKELIIGEPVVLLSSAGQQKHHNMHHFFHIHEHLF